MCFENTKELWHFCSARKMITSWLNTLPSHFFFQAEMSTILGKIRILPHHKPEENLDAVQLSLKRHIPVPHLQFYQEENRDEAFPSALLPNDTITSMLSKLNTLTLQSLYLQTPRHYGRRKQSFYWKQGRLTVTGECFTPEMNPIYITIFMQFSCSIYTICWLKRL